jgi:hypothetical protein
VQFHSFRAARAGGVHDRAAAEAQAHRARVELRTEWHARLRERASARGILFLATPFDEERATLLAALGVPAFPWPGDLERGASARSGRFRGGPVLLGSPARAAARSTPHSSRSGRAPARRRAVRRSLVTGPNGGDGAALDGVGRLDERYACLVGWATGSRRRCSRCGRSRAARACVVKPFTDDRRGAAPGMRARSTRPRRRDGARPQSSSRRSASRARRGRSRRRTSRGRRIGRMR